MLSINSVYGVNKSQPNFKRNGKMVQVANAVCHSTALKVAGAVATIGLALGGGYQWGVVASEDKLVQAEETYKKAEELNKVSCKAVADIATLAKDGLNSQAASLKEIAQQAQREKQAREGLITGLNHVKKISKEPSGLFGWGGFKGTAADMANEVGRLQNQARIKTISFEEYMQQAQGQTTVLNSKIDSIQKKVLRQYD